MGKPAGQTEKLDLLRTQTETMKQNQAQFQQIFESIKPYAQSMMQLGFTPEEFLRSPLGQSLLAQQLPAISKAYGQASNNLIEGSGAAGQYGGGTMAGPLAGLERARAGDISSLYQNLPLQGLNIGMQGLNALTGQQSGLNPLGWGAAAGKTEIPQGGFWKAFTEGLGSSLGDVKSGFSF